MKKLIFIIIAVLLIGFAGIEYVTGSFGIITESIHEKKKMSIDKIEQIEIVQASTDVYIKRAENEEMTVELKGKVSKNLKDQFSLEVKESGDTVKIAVIQENKRKPNIGVHMMNVILEVALPEKDYKKLYVDLVSGDIMLNKIKAEEITLNTSSGDIHAKNSAAERSLSIHSLSGDMMLNDIKAENMQVEVTSGNMFISNTKTKSLALSSASGDVQLNDVTGNIAVDNISGDIFIKNDELDGNMKIHSTSGDIDIQLKKDPQSLALNYEGISGEGDVLINGMNFEEKSDHRIKGKIGKGDLIIDVSTSSGDFTLQ